MKRNRTNRGFFGGAIGYVDGAGDGEFSVAIRSGVFDGEAGWLYAGCGVVDGSNARDEFDEIDLKLQTILSAFTTPEQKQQRTQQTIANTTAKNERKTTTT